MAGTVTFELAPCNGLIRFMYTRVETLSSSSTSVIKVRGLEAFPLIGRAFPVQCPSDAEPLSLQSHR